MELPSSSPAKKTPKKKAAQVQEQKQSQEPEQAQAQSQEQAQPQQQLQRQQQRQPKAHKLTPEFLNRIRTTLQTFAECYDAYYEFDPSLKKFQRAEVYKLSRTMGMKAVSSGSKAQKSRHVTVYKIKQNYPTKWTSFSFSEQGKVVLRDFFSLYPPGDHRESEKVMELASENNNNIRRYTNDIFHKPLMKRDEIDKKVESVVAMMESDPKLKQITKERSKLPIASYKDIITATLQSNQVVLISGETGCGKTTQVPQYLLDYMWSKGEACKVVCTQPRRISAISVAERISFERGESIGNSVGYKIRLESQGGRHSSIIFCTNGILLKILVESGNNRRSVASRTLTKDAFPDITHIIVDEIHERDRNSDFMLAIIRKILPRYPHLRVVLMSATFDAERFSQYFGGCPIIRVPGFTFDVKKFYLEDVLLLVKPGKISQLDSQLTKELRLALDEAINMAWSNDEMDSLLDLVLGGKGSSALNFQHSVTGVTPLMVFARRGRMADMCALLSLGADSRLQDKEGKTALLWAEHENQTEAAEILRKHADANSMDSEEGQHLLENYLQNVNSELIDVILIDQLVSKICREHEEGAILVFLPGWDEINKIQERLSKNAEYSDSSKYLIFALHSMIPSAEQKKVFQKPPKGCRKIILSTNIAETAVTIDDVVFVIDTGRMKVKSYDPLNKVSTLESDWISKASAKQREGRAGRCQPGICYHLFSKLRAASLGEYQVPEIRRTPIEELCLQVKLFDPNYKVQDFFNYLLDPPVPEAIHNAISILQDIGALSPDEKLTELGEKLGSIPVHPVTSKMLLFAISVNCLGPALTLACANDCKDCFTLPMSPAEKAKANKAKCELAALYGGHGDQLATIAAYECWKKAKEMGQQQAFCSQYFVSESVMYMLSKIRNRLYQELEKNGFISEIASRVDANAYDLGVIHAILVAGYYPRVGRLMRKNQFMIETADYNHVKLSNQSVNTKLKITKMDKYPMVIYDEVTRGDMGLVIKGCCVVGPLPVLLLAKEIAVAPCNEKNGNEGDEGFMSYPENKVKVVADRWLSFQATALDAAQIYCLRERLSAAVNFKLTNPGKELPELLEASVYAITKILSIDGLVGMNSLTYMSESKEGEGSLSTDNPQQHAEASGPLEHQNQTPSGAGKDRKRHQDGNPQQQAEGSGPLQHQNQTPNGADKERKCHRDGNQQQHAEGLSPLELQNQTPTGAGKERKRHWDGNPQQRAEGSGSLELQNQTPNGAGKERKRHRDGNAQQQAEGSGPLQYQNQTPNAEGSDPLEHLNQTPNSAGKERKRHRDGNPQQHVEGSGPLELQNQTPSGAGKERKRHRDGNPQQQAEGLGSLQHQNQTPNSAGKEMKRHRDSNPQQHAEGSGPLEHQNQTPNVAGKEKKRHRDGNPKQHAEGLGPSEIQNQTPKVAGKEKKRHRDSNPQQQAEGSGLLEHQNQTPNVSGKEKKRHRDGNSKQHAKGSGPLEHENQTPNGASKERKRHRDGC